MPENFAFYHSLILLITFLLIISKKIRVAYPVLKI